MNTFSQRNLAAGELDPALHARPDMVKYTTGAKAVRNFMVMRQGGVTNRPGFLVVAEAKDSNKLCVIVPFVYDFETTYCLEFGDLYMRVHKNGAPVYSSTKAITAIASGATTVLTSAAHGFTNGQHIDISGILGMTELNGRTFVVANKTTDTFEIKNKAGAAIVSSGYGAYISGGSAKLIYEIVTTFTEANLLSLNFKQHDNQLIITSKTYPLVEVTRVSDTSWSSLINYYNSNGKPGPFSATWLGVAGGVDTQYAITAVFETREESMPTYTGSATAAAATPSAPNAVTWTASPAGVAVEYNIYKKINGVYGFIGIASGLSFSDIGTNPDVTDTPPAYLTGDGTAFNVSGNYVSNTCAYQQRRLLFNTTNYPNRIWGSKIGYPKNFTRKIPADASDAFDFTLSGAGYINEIRHAVDLGTLVILTASGEWVAQGDSNGAITPTNGPNWRQHSYYGSSKITPIVMGGNMLYVQTQGSVVRDFGFDYQVDGYRGNDLTVFSAHLFKNKTITSWAYQQVPHSTVWMIRSDGVLIGLTYLREHDILGWHRHDTDGIYEQICSVPEGNETVIYTVVKRTINGETRRYIERMTNREQAETIDLVLMDCAKTYDGRNTGATTMTLSGGTLWTDEETLTLTSSTSYFTSADVGSSIHIEDADDIIRFEITGYTSASVVTGRAHKTVPVDMRGVAITNWAKAIKVMTSLWHLEGKDVSVFADSMVVSSPNNPAYDKVTVTNGKITLASAYAVIHVGLPYTSDLQTLNTDFAQAETMANKKINTSAVAVHVNDTRGIFAGTEEPTGTDMLEGLTEVKPRSSEPYESAASLMSGVKEINIGANWDSNGSVFIRQVDPLPATIAAVYPSGLYPIKKGL